MTRVNIHAAKTTLSRLIAGIEDGGSEVVLCRAGRPVAKIVPAPKAGKRPVSGVLAGDIWLADDFDAPEGQIFGIKP